MGHYLSSNNQFSIRAINERKPQLYTSRVPFISALIIFSNSQIYFIYLVFFILHSLTTRLAVHLGKSESGSLFDTGYFVIFKVYYFDYMR